MCIVLHFGLPGGPIVLEGFVGNLLRYEPRSSQEVKERYKPANGLFLAGTTYD
jgi:hypothetical protein